MHLYNANSFVCCLQLVEDSVPRCDCIPVSAKEGSVLQRGFGGGEAGQVTALSLQQGLGQDHSSRGTPRAVHGAPFLLTSTEGNEGPL